MTLREKASELFVSKGVTMLVTSIISSFFHNVFIHSDGLFNFKSVILLSSHATILDMFNILLFDEG